jgi:hypothetical protein
MRRPSASANQDSESYTVTVHDDQVCNEGAEGLRETKKLEATRKKGGVRGFMVGC